MSPMHKSIAALAASALLATVGFATAQSTDSSTTTDANGNQTTTTTTVDTQTQVLPAPDTGVVELAKPKGTVMPEKGADNAMGMQNNLMTTGVVDGITRPSIGDHATPPIPGPDTEVTVTKETTTTTTVTPPQEVPVADPTPAPQPEATPAADPAPEPMPAPKADRN